MANFVIVHGGFGGGWEWAEVARELRVQGHEVHTPTLTGMGERWHLGPKVGLSVHVKDVMASLEFEDLHRVVLCGASYGGMPVTGAADQSAERIALLIYIDALVPKDGQSALDLFPATVGEMIRANADADGHGWVEVPEAILPPAGLIPEDKRARYVSRLRPQPVATFTEAVQLTDGIDTIPRAFIRCIVEGPEGAGDPIAPIAARAMAENWLYREVHAPHDPHLFDPGGTAELLHELAITCG
jgi:pimeloyl-ACP methyl ester carboxylesterase